MTDRDEFIAKFRNWFPSAESAERFLDAMTEHPDVVLRALGGERFFDGVAVTWEFPR